MADLEQRILTRHPQGKSGVHISREKYDAVREVIVDAIRTHGELTFARLLEEAHGILESRFEGSINRYVTTVKLDLEARETIERLPGSRPQRLRLARSQQ